MTRPPSSRCGQRFEAIHVALRRDTGALATEAIEAVLAA